MNTKKIVLIVLILVVALGAAWAEGQGERSWKVGHVRPQGTSTDTDLVAFTEAVGEASGGSISIEVFPASQLGNYTVVQERVGIGDVECSWHQPPIRSQRPSQSLRHLIWSPPGTMPGKCLPER